MQTTSQSLQVALERILIEAREHGGPAGQLQRPAYFREATIVMDDGKRRPAFTRDLSQDGISLMHLGELDLTEVDLRVAATSDTSIRLRVRIAWSREVKDGWYKSGGAIISVLGHPELQRTQPDEEPSRR
jgi:hypothetical protein